MGQWFFYFTIKINILKLKSKLIKVFILIKAIAAGIILLLLLYFFIFEVAGINIKYETKYDILNYQDSQYVILMVNDNNGIIAEFDENNIYTSEYIIIDLSDEIIKSYEFKKPPEIK